MKINQQKINNAYYSLAYLSKLKLPIKISFDLYKISKILEENFNFYLQQERNLISHYEGSVSDEGVVTFVDEGTATKFKEDMEDLINLEHELNFDPITIELDSISDQKVSMSDIKNLDGIVIFK